MAKPPIMVGGVRALYCGSTCCCLMIGLGAYRGLLWGFKEAMDVLEDAVGGGTDLRVLVNATGSFSSSCKAECRVMSRQWPQLPVPKTQPGDPSTLYRCDKVSDKRADCTCDSKHFLIESSTSFGPISGCLLVEQVDIDSVRPNLYGHDQAAIFLPKGKKTILKRTLCSSIGTKKMHFNNWSRAPLA